MPFVLEKKASRYRVNGKKLNNTFYEQLLSIEHKRHTAKQKI